MVQFERIVQQIGMNMSWRNLGSGGEFLVLSASGTSGLKCMVKRGEGIAANITDSRIDTQDQGICPSFPGRFCSCRPVAVVHLKGTSSTNTEAARKAHGQINRKPPQRTRRLL
ncbi:hypothetical protein T265_06087 [Opisthorchis viverrini]|uniref:Uncharacterized protein n=1 Tax=Opisthorchis viverrini TaxID=6198 RepID=A0A074ZTL7_OPIVI|nr:hypothetical protein T265_06087 [Opisthorchis viverrini]KER26725.1 hypothetical protein T265_06087 [Opisthorchis viverrini]